MTQISLFRGMMLGSLAGASLSLFQKQTRDNTVQTMRKLKATMTDLDSITTAITNKSEKIRTTAEKLSNDISFVLEKVEELKQVTPAIAGIVKDTKQAFSKGSNEQQENKQTSSVHYLP
ncbi:MAG: YtxH domain-containing protein [Bacillus sp. (in: firmicutes)]